MSKDDLIDMQGTVVAVHSGGLYRVQVDAGHEVLAQLSGRMRRFRIKVVPGDRVTVGISPYDPQRGWDGSDFMGSSLQALTNMAARRGYRLVGTNITGSNAFFVRAELAGSKFAEPDAAALYNPARYWLTTGFVAGHSPGENFGYTSDAALNR